MNLEFAADAPAPDIADCVYRNGVALVRDHYQTGLIAEIAAQAAHRYARDDARARANEQPADPHRAFGVDDIVIDGRPASDHLVTDLARFVSGVCLETLSPTVTHAFVRTSVPGAADLTLPFHQDSRIVSKPLINLWIPLSACGRTIPGLEVVARRLDLLVATLPYGTGGNIYAANGLEIDAATVAATYAADLWHPEFKTGDVLIFLGTTVHRTHVTPGMTGPRTSIDLRLVKPA